MHDFTLFITGGPVLLEKDGTLLGVISSRVHHGETRIPTTQGFMKLTYFFDWISKITGLDLPNCKGMSV